MRSEISRKDTSPRPTQQNKKTNLALHNTIPPNSSKSQRNLNEEVVSNTATTIAKSNLQGTAHNIIQKGALTLKTYSQEQKYNKAERTKPRILKSRRPVNPYQHMCKTESKSGPSITKHHAAQ